MNNTNLTTNNIRKPRAGRVPEVEVNDISAVTQIQLTGRYTVEELRTIKTGLKRIITQAIQSAGKRISLEYVFTSGNGQVARFEDVPPLIQD